MASSYLENLFSLKGRTAVVVGGTGVLGGALADGLAGAGAFVVVAGRGADRGAARVAAIRAAGGDGAFVSVDACDRGSVQALLDATVTARGRADILVNCAGVNSATPYFDIPDEDFADTPFGLVQLQPAHGSDVGERIQSLQRLSRMRTQFLSPLGKVQSHGTIAQLQLRVKLADVQSGEKPFGSEKGRWRSLLVQFQQVIAKFDRSLGFARLLVKLGESQLQFSVLGSPLDSRLQQTGRFRQLAVELGLDRLGLRPAGLFARQVMTGQRQAEDRQQKNQGHPSPASRGLQGRG